MTERKDIKRGRANRLELAFQFEGVLNPQGEDESQKLQANPMGNTPDMQQASLPQGTAINPTTPSRFVHGDLGFTDPIQRYRALLTGTGANPEVIDSFLDDQQRANENAPAPTPIERHPGIKFCLHPPSEEDCYEPEAKP